MDDPFLIDGRFRLGVELGAGAFGSVYKATQIVLGRDMRDVALKLFKSDVINEDNIHRQMNDALAINALLSDLSDWEIRQHFVTVYDLGLTRDEPPRAYVAMELVREGSLAKRIRDLNHFTLSGTLHYLKQMVRALAFMHSHRYVHSDLKPDNILLFRHGGQDHVKIGDFGLSGKYQGLLGGDGPRGGDMAYMAPEVLMGLNTTPAADVFSLGVMAYEMVTGRNPYGHVGESLSAEDRENDAKMRELRLSYRREPLRLYPGDFPELSAGPAGARLMPVLQVINRMLEPSPEHRYRSAVEIQNDFQHLFGEQFGASTAVTPTTVDATQIQDETAVARRQSELESQWESAIGLKGWDTAQRLAEEMVTLNPDSADGHIHLGETKRRQAESLAAAGRSPKLVEDLLRKSVRFLSDGLRAVTPAEQTRVRQRLAHVYRLLNDEQAANLVLKGSG